MDQREYVRRLLAAYPTTPGTAGVVRCPDRLFAVQLNERAVLLEPGVLLDLGGLQPQLQGHSYQVGLFKLPTLEHLNGCR